MEANKDLVRGLFEELVNRNNLNVVDDLFASDFVSHENLPPGVSSGREGVKQLFGMMRSGFPDLRVTIDDLIAEGDRVVARVTFAGTHQGEFMGIPATGRPIKYAVIDILRITDGRVVEHWAASDDLGLMQQLGALPPPGS